MPPAIARVPPIAEAPPVAAPAAPPAALPAPPATDEPQRTPEGRPAHDMQAHPEAMSVLARIEEKSGQIPRVMLQDVPSEPSPLVMTGARSVPSDRALDHYDIVGEIGRGAMGTILKARDVDLGRDVALKVLRQDLAKRPELAQRFVEEAQISGQLQHPGIAPLYELGVHPDGRPYFAMKLIKGRTLSALLNARSNVLQGRHRFLAIFEKVCQAMAYAHSRGVIHRDIKPANIMVGAFGETQVMDWGFAKVLERGGIADERDAHRLHSVISVIETLRHEDEEVGSRSLAGSLMGTPPYMPPEQASGNIDLVDARSDVFALGAVLCEILTGKPPYVLDDPDGGVANIILQASRAKLEPARQRLEASGADEELLRICNSCLTPAQAARPADGGALAKEISDYLAAVDERARTSQLAAVAERGRAATAQAQAAAAARVAEQERKSRRLTLALGTAVLAVVLLGGGGLVMFQNQRKAREAQTTRTVSAALVDAERLRGLAMADALGELSNWSAALTAANAAEKLAVSAEAGEELIARTVETRELIQKESDAATRLAEQTERDRRMVARLEAIRAQKGDDFSPRRSEALYEAAFREYGIELDHGSARDVGASVAASEIVTDLVAALDEWSWVRAYGTVPQASMGRPSEVAGIADDDPWRRQLRGAIGRGDTSRLHRLAREGDPAALGVTSVHLLASALANAGDQEAAVGFLQRARFHHSDDLWINFYLGHWLTELTPPRWNEAARAYSAAVAARPDGAAAWNNLGITLQSLGEIDDAVAAFERAIAVQPEYASAHNNLGTLRVGLSRYEEALASYREAVRVQPDHALAYYGIGATLQRMGQSEEAVEAYRTALTHQPDLREAYDAMVSLLNARGQGAEVLEASKRTLESNSQAAWAHRNHAHALWANGRRTEALAQYRKALAIDPKDGVALHDYGIAQARLGRWDGAIEHLERACLASPREAQFRSDLGWALEQQGDLDGAVREFRRALKQDPKLFVGHDQLGSVLMRQGDLDGAQASYFDAIAADPYDATLIAYRNLGNLLGRRLGQAEAEALYEAEVAKDTEAGHVAFLLALAASLIQTTLDYEGAMAAVQNAKALAADDSLVWAYEGLLQRLMGDPDAAIVSSRRAIKLDSYSALARCYLGFALQAKGRFEDAVDAMREGHALGTEARWTNPSQAWVASAERLAKIHTELAVYLSGEKEPADLTEALSLAYVYRCTRRWAGAAAVYARILDDDGHPLATRYVTLQPAACVAARAGTLLGRSNDAKRATSEERKALRAQALAWLTKDLARLQEQIREAPDARGLLGVVRRWTKEPDLAGIREPDRLATLDPEEREAFAKLWRDVAATLGE